MVWPLLAALFAKGGAAAVGSGAASAGAAAGGASALGGLGALGAGVGRGVGLLSGGAAKGAMLNTAAPIAAAVPANAGLLSRMRPALQRYQQLSDQYGQAFSGGGGQQEQAASAANLAKLQALLMQQSAQGLSSQGVQRPGAGQNPFVVRY